MGHEKSLIEYGDFTLSAGSKSSWRINAEALDDATLNTIVQVAVGVLRPFGSVVGIARGGIRIGRCFERYIEPEGYPHRILIVDDVLTSGASMTRQRDISRQRPVGGNIPTVEGFVLFARTDSLPAWIRTFFACNWWLR